jgi:hypothetical protein
MFCHQCGSAVSDGATTCASCGADVRAKDQGATQPIPASDATIRIGPMGSVPVPATPAGPAAVEATAPTNPFVLPATTILTPSDPTTAKVVPPTVARPNGSRNSAPLAMLFGVAALLGVAAFGAYRWSAGRTAPAEVPVAAATPAPAPVPPPAAPAPAPADPAATTPPAPVDPPAADPATPPAPAAVPATGPGSGPALLATARKERDAAISQRDAALDQVRQLRDELTRVRATAAATPAPAAPAPTSPDTAKLAQLQKEHDTVRYIVGSKKQLINDKVIESHLYLLPPPAASLSSITLSQTTDISFDGKSYGLNNVKNVVLIPSSVWEGTDYKTTISGATVKVTILRPDAFRTLARYFVLMLE